MYINLMSTCLNLKVKKSNRLFFIINCVYVKFMVCIRQMNVGQTFRFATIDTYCAYTIITFDLFKTMINRRHFIRKNDL